MKKLLLLCCIYFTWWAGAAESDGDIRGKVMETGNKNAVGAEVTIKNKETGLTKTTMSGDDGRFQFLNIPLGVYEVSATKNGESTQTVEARVRLGDAAIVNLGLGESVEKIEVVGSRISPVDTMSNEAGLVIDAETLDRMPVGRDITSVALLEPTASRGVGNFGGNPTFGGSTVAENQYYINGLNISNFNKAIEPSDIPFSLFDEFQVKTGAYSAEFGRSTGGVVNTTTKRGGNEFHAGANLYLIPNAFRGKSENLKSNKGEGRFIAYSEKDERSQTEYDLWASGPILKDKLFFFGLLNPTMVSGVDYSTTQKTKYERSPLFWAGKLDYYATSDHLFELTLLSDARETKYSYWKYTIDDGEGDKKPGAKLKKGGLHYALKYTGNITDELSLSFLYGQNNHRSTSVLDNQDTSRVFDQRQGVAAGDLITGPQTSSTYNTSEDVRDVMRIDGDYLLSNVKGDHELRFGLDREVLKSKSTTDMTGGYRYQYKSRSTCESGNPADVACGMVVQTEYGNKGDYKTTAMAFYAQDRWISPFGVDELTLNLGLRSESFENFNGAGKSMIKQANQLAPRLGAAYDVLGDGNSKVFVSWGRYHLPVPNNTNIRLGGQEYFARRTVGYTGVNSDGTPILNENEVLSDWSGTRKSSAKVSETKAVIDSEIGPMYQDEIVLGYQMNVMSEWLFGARYVMRDLKQVIEDITVDAALKAKVGDTCTHCSFNYVLANPGKEVKITLDPDDDGPIPETTYTLSADDLGYPKPKRKNNMLEIVLQRPWDGLWSANFSYVWAKSTGNYEGYTKSDNGQADPGLTQDYDFAGLMDHADGPLPNDRTHRIKLFGSYKVTDFILGGTFIMQSGTPKSKFGNHPTDENSQQYGHDNHFAMGKPAPRGDEGRQATWNQIDLSVKYLFAINNYKGNVKFDILNVLNSSTVLTTDEYYEDTAKPGHKVEDLVKNKDYDMPTSKQSPRSFKLSLGVEM